VCIAVLSSAAFYLQHLEVLKTWCCGVRLQGLYQPFFMFVLPMHVHACPSCPLQLPHEMDRWAPVVLSLDVSFLKDILSSDILAVECEFDR
jgi:hypothetical protein